MEATVNGKADAWRQRIAAQRISGQSIRAWCRQNDQPEHAFHWWRSRLGLAPRPKHARWRSSKPAEMPGSPLTFTKVNLIPPPASEPLRLRLAGPVDRSVGTGRRELLLPMSMPMSQVAELLLALENRS